MALRHALLNFRGLVTARREVPYQVRAGLISASVMTCSDAICQLLIRPPAPAADALAGAPLDPNGQADRVTERRPYDVNRTLRFAVVGFTLHGPFFSTGLRLIERLYGPSKGFATVLKKTATSQLAMFPIYLTSFFAYMGLLEGKSVAQIRVKMEEGLPSTFAGGMGFWTVANIVNFSVVPPGSRILYLNCSALVFNTYLSWANARIAIVPPPSLVEGERQVEAL